MVLSLHESDKCICSSEITMEDALRDIVNACKPYSSSGKDGPDEISYKHMSPKRQQGPTCGLVALEIISSLSPRKWTLEDLLEDSQALGFSKSGEMFSADNMAIFAKHVLGDYFSVELLTGGLAPQKNSILQDLLYGQALYLVPYDSDKNHSPACLKGHKAHWAVLCGAVVCHEKIYILARQGKSKHICVWSFDDLDKSNSNLIEICPNRLSDSEKYVFHDLRISMNGKFIKLVELDNL